MDGERVDEVLLALGKWGKWQTLQALLLSLTYIPLAFQYTSIVFIGYEPNFRCATSNATLKEVLQSHNGTVSEYAKKCHLWDPASNSSKLCDSNFEYEEPPYISIASEWNLVCESAYLVQLSQTFLSMGLIMGYVIMPLSDRFGRKRTLVVCHWLILIASASMALSPNIIVFIALKFVCGFLIPAVNIIMCLMLVELFPAGQRAQVAMVSKFIWAGGIMVLTLVSYFFRNTSWRYLQLCLSCFYILVVIQTFFLEDSVRWLLSVNRRKEATVILKRAAKLNNISFEEKVFPLLDGFQFGSISILSSIQDIALANISCSRSSLNYSSSRVPGNIEISVFVQDSDMTNINSSPKLSSLKVTGTLEKNEATKSESNCDLNCEKSSNIHNARIDPKTSDCDENQKMLLKSKMAEVDVAKPNVLDLFRHKTLRKYVLISSYIMTVDVLLYYGLLLMSSSLAGDRFINVLLSGAVEIPAYLLCMYVLDRFGRKICLHGFHMLSGGMLVLAIIVNVTDGPDLLVTAFATLGKFGSCGTLIVSFLHNSEIIPTNLRGLGMGVSGGFAGIGGLLAPFSMYLVHFGVWIPGTVFAVCCAMVCVLLFSLPETRGRQLPQTIADMDRWAAKKRQHDCEESNISAAKSKFRIKCCQ